MYSQFCSESAEAGKSGTRPSLVTTKEPQKAKHERDSSRSSQKSSLVSQFDLFLSNFTSARPKRFSLFSNNWFNKRHKNLDFLLA